MKAIFFEKHGGIENLKYADLPDPEPKFGEALIKVKSCALNHLDIWVRRGWEGLHLDLPHITGNDILGEVVQVNGASDWKPGSRVIINPGIATGDDEWTRNGEDSVSPTYKIIGEQLKGGMAELVAVPIQNVFTAPVNWSDETAAASLLVGTTCWRMLFKRAELKAGDSVLIVGSGGGVNSLSISFAKHAGAIVFVLAGNEEKAAKARSLGADQIINYNEIKNWHAEVLKLTKGRGVDIVIDNVGTETLAKSFRAVTRGGKVVTVGNTSGYNINFDNRIVFSKQISYIGSTMGSRQDFIDAISFMVNNNIKPIIDCVEPLSNGIKMLQRLEAGKQFGKIVLSC